MARLGVEYKDVERASRSLFAQGLNPSVQKVRDLLGTGSNTTIANHLKTWRESFKASNSPLLPQSVPDDLMNPLDEFWSSAMAKADSNYQNFKNELEAKLKTAEANEQLAFNQLTAKTNDFETLQELQKVTEGQVKQTEQQFLTLQGEHSALTSELKHTHSEMERAFTLLHDQKQGFDVEREKDNKEHQEALKYEHERANSTENRFLNEIDQLRQNIKLIEDKRIAQVKEIKADLEKSRHKEQTILHEQSGLQLENQQLNAERYKQRQESEVLKNQLITAQSQLTQSIETVEALRLAFEQSKDNEIHLTNNIAQLKVDIARLQVTNKD